MLVKNGAMKTVREAILLGGLLVIEFLAQV